MLYVIQAEIQVDELCLRATVCIEDAMKSLKGFDFPLEAKQNHGRLDDQICFSFVLFGTTAVIATSSSDFGSAVCSIC